MLRIWVVTYKNSPPSTTDSHMSLCDAVLHCCLCFPPLLSWFFRMELVLPDNPSLIHFNSCFIGPTQEVKPL